MSVRRFAMVGLLGLGIQSGWPDAAAPAPRWPQWRGPNGNAVVETALPTGWSPTSNIAWKVALPGPGNSTPVVWDDRIVLTVAMDGQDGVLALDLQGRELWRTRLGPSRPPKHRSASSCNPSPVTDGHLVWVYFKSGTFAALTLDGQLRWRVNIEELFGPDELVWDVGTSPVLVSNLVVLSVMNGPRSYLAAWERESGRLVWRVPRAYPCAYEADQGYTTPMVFEFRGRDVVLVWNAEHLTLHDSRDGHVLWDCGGFNPDQRPNWPPVASPVRVGERIVVPYGRGQRLFAVDLVGDGEVTTRAHRWVRTDTGSYVPTPVVWNGRILLLRDRHQVECIRPEDGSTEWVGLLERSSVPFYASPLVAGDHLYAVREDGVVFVASLRDEFRLVSRIPMAEPMRATPVPLGRRLLLRGSQTLWCIGQQL